MTDFDPEAAERERARPHIRAVIAAAIAVAMARIELQQAEAEVDDTIRGQFDPTLLHVPQEIGVDLTRVHAAGQALQEAVNHLTAVCIAAQLASDARDN